MDVVRFTPYRMIGLSTRLIASFTFIDLRRSAHTANLRTFDIRIEAKAKDLALLRLREQGLPLHQI